MDGFATTSNNCVIFLFASGNNPLQIVPGFRVGDSFDAAAVTLSTADIFFHNAVAVVKRGQCAHNSFFLVTEGVTSSYITIFLTG